MASHSALKRPALVFVGPALGGHAGRVVSQAEILAPLLEVEGYRTSVVSRIPNPVGRAVDTVASLIKRGRDYDVAIVSVFSGKGFAQAELATTVLRSLRKPMVLVLHGGNLPEFSHRHRRWVRRVLRRGNVILAPSTYLQHELRSLGFDIRVVPNVLE